MNTFSFTLYLFIHFLTTFRWMSVLFPSAHPGAVKCLSWSLNCSTSSSLRMQLTHFFASEWRIKCNYSCAVQWIRRRRCRRQAFSGTRVATLWQQPTLHLVATIFERRMGTRVARFFSVQNNKTRKNIPNEHCNKCTKCTKWSLNVVFGSKVDKITVKYTNICHCKTFQNLPKLGLLV
jgi:hypothetical protein